MSPGDMGMMGDMMGPGEMDFGEDMMGDMMGDMDFGDISMGQQEINSKHFKIAFIKSLYF